MCSIFFKLKRERRAKEMSSFKNVHLQIGRVEKKMRHLPNGMMQNNIDVLVHCTYVSFFDISQRKGWTKLNENNARDLISNENWMKNSLYSVELIYLIYVFFLRFVSFHFSPIHTCVCVCIAVIHCAVCQVIAYKWIKVKLFIFNSWYYSCIRFYWFTILKPSLLASVLLYLEISYLIVWTKKKQKKKNRNRHE